MVFNIYTYKTNLKNTIFKKAKIKKNW